MTASSVRATARNTIAPAASAAGRPRPTSRCPPTSSSPTPRSASADPNHRPGLKRMSGPSTYQPQNAFLRWFEARLPIGGVIHSSFVVYPTPRNLNYWWAFGAILSFMLGAQIVLEHIMRDVNYGWLLRYLHSNGASMFFIAVYIHMFRGLYYGSYKEPREVLW